MKELVTVIIPTYKGRASIRRAIDSVIAQEYSDIEIIIVDDNGRGTEEQVKTASYINSFLNRPYLHYIIHEVNKGGSAARNTGINFSKGTYLAFLDDDDWFLPNKISCQIKYLQDHPSINGVYCQGYRDGRVIKANLKAGDLSEDILLLKSYAMTPSLFLRKEAVVNIGGFDESFRRHQDYEFLLRYFANGNIIGVINKPLYCLGPNDGENIPTVEQILKLKEYFFEKFNSHIIKLKSSHYKIEDRIYGVHYGAVFVSCVKNKRFNLGLKLFNQFFWRAPIDFSRPMRRSIYIKFSQKFHLFRINQNT